jgi:dihydroflavonol-4-reductase
MVLLRPIPKPRTGFDVYLVAQAIVTGATGFIGTHLVRALVERGDNVTCVVRATSAAERVEQLRRFGAQVVQAELAALPLEPALQRGEVVYHVAGATRARSRREFLQINAQATSTLLQALARRQTPPVFVLVSSLAAAGPSLPGKAQSEEHAPAPVSHYGTSKLAAELSARSVADKVPITILRPPMVLGAGDRVTVVLFRSLKRVAVHLMPGFRRRQYSLVFVEDLIRGIIAAAGRGERLPVPSAEDRARLQRITPEAETFRKGWPTRWDDLARACRGQGVYYLASQQQITYARLGRLVATAMGWRRMLPLPVPRSLIWCMASWNEVIARARGRASFFGWDKWREVTTGDWTCSSAKAREQLGFVAHDDFAAQIQAACDWYRSHGWL